MEDKVTCMHGGHIHLHYKTSGIGDIPVILVHGYGMSSAVWERVMPLFPSEYRLFAPDLRGFGRSDKPSSGYGCRDLAEDISAFMDSLDLPRAVLFGHSFGGQVVQHFAAQYPERVLALALSNTIAATIESGGLDTDVEKRIRGYGSVPENRKIFSVNIPRYFDAVNVTSKDIEYFIEIGLQADNQALREALKANYTTPALPAGQYEALRAPVLILVSTHDPFGPFDHAIAMSDAFPVSRIEVMTHCGHTPMWEKPEEFTAKVVNFLNTAM